MLISKSAHALACYCSLSLILEAGSLGAEQCLQLFSTKISLTSRTWVQNQESLHDHMGYLWPSCVVDVVTVMQKVIAAYSQKTDRVG